MHGSRPNPFPGPGLDLDLGPDDPRPDPDPNASPDPDPNQDPDAGKNSALCTGDLVEINTNLVLFCFFKPAEDAPQQERCLILKFLHTRLLTQSEQFANELTRHLDICAPTCRMLRQKVHPKPCHLHQM